MKNIFFVIYLSITVFFSLSSRAEQVEQPANLSDNLLSENKQSNKIDSIPVASSTEKTRQLFSKMLETLHQRDYVISYVLTKRNVQPQRYNFFHMLIDGKRSAHLTNLNFPRIDVIQLDDQITYYLPAEPPASIKNSAMIEYLPNIINVKLDYFLKYYDLISLGTSREAGRFCDIIRVSSKDGSRFDYVLCIDKENQMLLRADLSDKDGGLLEQFLVIRVDMDVPLNEHFNKLLEDFQMPSDPFEPDQSSIDLGWTIKENELPLGFKMVHSLRRPILNNPNKEDGLQLEKPTEFIDSQLYSDGLFNFSVYLVPSNQSSESNLFSFQNSNSFSRSLTDRNLDVVVIGEIPMSTAKKIASSIEFIKKNNVDKMNGNETGGNKLNEKSSLTTN